ncbi:MAG: hypothetical protein ACRDL5_04795 [Solirubrobacteraceae bacterium]
MSPVPVIAAGLLRVVWASLGASLLVSVAFALTILGLVRRGELRTEGRAGLASAYTALAVCSLLVFAASIIYGVILVTHKS